MRKFLATLCTSAVALVAAADETSFVDYSTTVTSPNFDLVWSYETTTVGGVTSATITGVKTSGGDNPTGDLAVPYSVSASASGPAYVVKEIANDAFVNQIGITSVSIPVTVETIGNGIFTGCTILSSITVDDDNPWLTSINGVLYDKALNTLIACPAKTTSLTLPEKVRTIRDSAFASCSFLVEVIYLGNEPTAPDSIYADTPDELTSFVKGSAGFNQTETNMWRNRRIETWIPITVPIEVTVDSNQYIFNWKYKVNLDSHTAELSTIEPKPIEEIEIPGVIVGSIGGKTYSFTVTEIGDGAFCDAQALTKVKTSASLLKIGDYAFSNCTALADVEFSYGLRSIGKRPFVNTAIPELTLPDTLLEMDGNITAGAIYDMKLNISDSSHFTFSDDGVLYNKDMTKLYACPTRAEGTVTIPATVTNICADAFFGCFRLSYLNIPENVSTIGEGAFNVSGIWPGLSAPESTPKLLSVFYNGPKPNAADDIYDGAPDGLVSYALDDSWSGTPEWKGRPVTVIDEANPPILTYKDDNGITWYYRIINGEAEIYNDDNAAIAPKSTPGVPFHYNSEDAQYWSNLWVLNIPSAINGYVVTRVGNHAFDGCNNVTRIGIPSSVKSIGDYAFKDCTAIKTIAADREDSNSSLFFNDGEIELPTGIKSLGYHPFEGLKAFSISIPYTVLETSSNPLAGMEFVTSVEVDANNPKFYSSGNIIYNKGKTSLIGVPANYEGSSISFLASVTTIGAEAMLGCVNLSAITLPNALETISSNAFDGCTSVTELTIPATVTRIEAAFDGCDSLARVTYDGNAPTAPDNLYAGTPETMASWVNEGATGFTDGTWKNRPLTIIVNPVPPELSYNNGIATWYFRIVDGMAEIHRNGDTTAVVSDDPIMNLSLPDTLGGYIVKGIGNGALSNLRGITSISVPNTYEWIGDYAFSNCTSLASVSLGNGVERIGHWPFFGTKITTLEIPDSVSEIDGNPVAGCSLMQAVVVEDSQPYFSVDDGLLYDKNQETLIACPATKTSISYPETWKATNDDALYGCHIIDPNFTTIDGVTWGFTVTDDGKAKITSVQGATDTIEIPASLSGFEVAEIEDGVFADSPDVKAFTSRSAAFKVRNGVLYSADGKTLICVPNTLKLPYSVTTSNITSTVTETTDAGVGRDGLPYVNVTTTTNTSSARVSTQQFAGDISFETLLAGVTRICDKAFSGVNIFTNSYTAVTNGPSIGEAVPGDGTVHSYVKTTSIEIQHVSYATSVTLNPSVITVAEDAFADSGIVYKKTTSTGPQPPNQNPVIAPPDDDHGEQFTSTGLPPTDASTYDGFLTDGSGSLVGTIQVKVPKAKRNMAKIRATIRIAGKNSTARGTLDFTTGEVDDLDLTLGEYGMTGNYRGYQIVGARNRFTSKDKSEVTSANATLRPWLGTINVAWDGGVLSATVSAKGKVKISGTTENGSRISATSQIIIGEDVLCIPVVIAKKANVAFLLKLSSNGNGVEVEGIAGAVAGMPGALRANAELTVANGSIPSKLKFKANAKTGAFKGSFKVYGTDGRSTSVTMSGVAINGTGYGVAYVKKTAFSTIAIQ